MQVVERVVPLSIFSKKWKILAEQSNTHTRREGWGDSLCPLLYTILLARSLVFITKFIFHFLYQYFRFHTDKYWAIIEAFEAKSLLQIYY